MKISREIKLPRKLRKGFGKVVVFRMPLSQLTGKDIGVEYGISVCNACKRNTKGARLAAKMVIKEYRTALARHMKRIMRNNKEQL